jgi:hypothetical protein
MCPLIIESKKKHVDSAREKTPPCEKISLKIHRKEIHTVTVQVTLSHETKQLLHIQ